MLVLGKSWSGEAGKDGFSLALFAMTSQDAPKRQFSGMRNLYLTTIKLHFYSLAREQNRGSRAALKNGSF
jgi:hypothetical protein